MLEILESKIKHLKRSKAWNTAQMNKKTKTKLCKKKTKSKNKDVHELES